MAKIRDAQRSKVYESERNIPLGNELPTLEEMYRYASEIMATDWWKKHYPNVTKIVIKDGRRRKRPCGFRGALGEVVIKMPKASRYQRILLHEIAHGIKPGDPWHGKEFCGVYLMLLFQFMGNDCAQKLIDEFILRGVKYDMQIM